MDAQTKRRSVWFVLVLIFAFAFYKLITGHDRSVQTASFTAYHEGRKSKLNSADSLVVERFYDTLNTVLKAIISGQVDSTAHSFLKNAGPDFEVHVCTLELLDYFCDGPLVNSRGPQAKEEYRRKTFVEEQYPVQDLNTWLGNGDLVQELAGREWHSGVKSEIDNIYTDRYLLVVSTEALVMPELIEESNSFRNGLFEGRVYVIDMHSAAIVASKRIVATTDESVRSFRLKNYAVDDKLIRNLSDNVQEEVSRCSEAYFGKPLPDRGMQIAGLEMVHSVSPEELYAGITVYGLLFLMAFVLLRWYFKKQKKKDPPVVNLHYSSFYLRFKPIMDLIADVSFNGFGTRYMLYTGREPDGSFSATKWFILATFPVAPLYRQQIRIHSENTRRRFFYSLNSADISVIGLKPLSKRQNRAVYAFYYLFLYPSIFAPLAILLTHLPFFNRHFPGPQFWLLLLICFVWGIGMVALSGLFNKRFFLCRRTGDKL